MAKRAAKKNSPWRAHPAVDHVRKVMASMKERTGSDIDQWLKVLARSGIENRKDQKAWLRSEHGLGMTTATLITDLHGGEGSTWKDEASYFAAADGFMDSMFAGKKAGLQAIADALLEKARELGPDIGISPCKTMIPVYRKRVIARIVPATQSRVDFGLALADCSRKPVKRLVEIGKSGDRITHAFRIESPEQVDATVARWLGIAYGLDD